MVAKPSRFPEWATDPGRTSIPALARIQLGWGNGDVPNPLEQNDLHNLANEWLAYLDQEVDALQATRTIGLIGNTEVMSGAIAFDAGGNVDVAVAVTFAGTLPFVPDVQDVRFRVRDNGVDVWTCSFVAVDENLVTVAANNTSSGGGALEWVTVSPGAITVPNARYMYTLSTPNTALTSMLAHGVQIIQIPN